MDENVEFFCEKHGEWEGQEAAEECDGAVTSVRMWVCRGPLGHSHLERIQSSDPKDIQQAFLPLPC